MRIRLRLTLTVAALGLAACSDSAPVPQPEPTPAASFSHDPASGETKARIEPTGESAATLRSGPQVQVSLPSGLTLYPGATVITNTLVERDGDQRILVVFETPDAVSQVIRFYRSQARSAGVRLTLDLGSAQRASLGGPLPGGGDLVIAARQGQAGTRVEISAD